MMISPATLHIRLTSGQLPPAEGSTAVNQFLGGPETLLAWLEMQLGLQVAEVSTADRVTQYAGLLDAVTDSVISDSMRVDRWATATDLLNRRDELLLANWNESKPTDNLPALVQDLATANSDNPETFPAVAQRLVAVDAALASGAVLPNHSCILYDKPSKWPERWQLIFKNMEISEATRAVTHAISGSALQLAQSTILSGSAPDNATAPLDSSFRYLTTRSETAAVEAVAAILASGGDQLASTVICCEDENLAVRLDAALARLGLPTFGAAIFTQAHPILQILPLTLALCVEPVDPQVLLDFLNLPILPIPKAAARKLAKALSEQPGLGSSEWNKTLQNLYANVSFDNDGGESSAAATTKLKDRIDSWLHYERVGSGELIPTKQIANRCRMIAQWASGRAQMMEKDPTANSDVVTALKKTAGHASTVGKLAVSQGETISLPQLDRLTETAFGTGTRTRPQAKQHQSALLVQSLAEINGNYSRLIWLGLGTEDATRSRWSTAQLRLFREAGINLDDGNNALASLRGAEARGFCQITESFLAVGVPGDLVKRLHPIWISARSVIETGHPSEQELAAHSLEDFITTDNVADIVPFNFTCEKTTVVPHQPVRPEWNIPANLMQDRDRSSATELEARLACPLKWTLGYQAKLYPSNISQLPSGPLLYGLFLHSVLEDVFDGGGDLPSVEDAVSAVTEMFDKKLKTDAAPLAQASEYAIASELRGQLQFATKVLIEALSAGDYSIVGLEVKLDSEAFGRKLTGSIDCLAKRPDGKQAVIDFKFGRATARGEMLEDGKALQLATYAYASRDGADNFPAVAFLILNNGRFATPSGSALAGGEIEILDGPPIEDVWNAFVAAIENSGDWLTTDARVPARPLQDPANWPGGVELVLKDRLNRNETQSPCSYCDYSAICGRQPVD
jgi:ATP-dependent helicase/nuclease subunit B